ncbi:helicase [Kibdelosporangium phytohabitans]|uniref:Helicase n=2 Tax=Kibdelosporangium phytohabitans TaxID=860235 RepID=A0A0N9IE83_9PSEU|nr:ATP-binding domain-containing protein [Kibdelosporangium phytohabitans]ALG14769.1 helicase [Kibdelosporangium phytohabitans]
MEQVHLTVLYERLDDLRAEAARHLATAQPAERAYWAGETARLDSVADGLCFGRVDLDDGSRLYIGRAGLFDGDEPLLIDWRAPAARPFYTATAAAPEGVRLRRRITTRGRTVVDVNDELLTAEAAGEHDLAGDAALLAAVSAGRTEHMADIVTTLQAEQDRIIRDPYAGVLVVQGGPGTGKTAVALHRVAHLLYARPHLRTRGVLVIGPSTLFLDYIGQVLPGLGENSVVTATIADLRPGTPVSRTASDEEARRKGSAQAAGELASAVRDSVHVPAEPVEVVFEQEALSLSPADCRRAVRRAKHAGLPHNQARLVFHREVVTALADSLAARLEAVTLTDTGEAIDGGDPDGRLSAADLRALEAAGVIVDWTDSAPRRLLDDTDVARLRDALLADARVQDALDGIWPPLAVAELVPGPWSPVDIPLLDEAAALIDGGDGTTYGHIVVDEAQELSEMAWRMLMRRCPSRSMTVVGDLAQTSDPAGATTWPDMLRPHVADRWELAELTVNYRTPAEIMAVANEVLADQPGFRPSTSVRSTGVPPLEVTGSLDLLGDLVARMPGRVAVITPQRHLAPVAHQFPEVVSLTPGQAKGLEFDSVVVVDPDAIAASGPRGRNDLYVAMTRATRSLAVLRTRQ